MTILQEATISEIWDELRRRANIGRGCAVLGIEVDHEKDPSMSRLWMRYSGVGFHAAGLCEGIKELAIRNANRDDPPADES